MPTHDRPLRDPGEDEFFRLVRELRVKHREYFKGRSPETLKRVQELEARCREIAEPHLGKLGYTPFLELVHAYDAMSDAQVQHFLSPKAETLLEAKEAERDVDALLRRDDKANAVFPLFDKEGGPNV